MKKALYYTMVTGWSVLYAPSVMAVTSEKGYQLYGRDGDGNPTHRHRRDTIGKFKNMESLEACREKIQALRQHYQTKVNVQMEAVRDIREQEKAALKILLIEAGAE